MRLMNMMLMTALAAMPCILFSGESLAGERDHEAIGPRDGGILGAPVSVQTQQTLAIELPGKVFTEHNVIRAIQTSISRGDRRAGGLETERTATDTENIAPLCVAVENFLFELRYNGNDMCKVFTDHNCIDLLEIDCGDIRTYQMKPDDVGVDVYE